MFRVAFALFVFCAVLVKPANAQDGVLDPAFVSGYGYRLISYSGLASENDTTSTLLVQPDGRILFAVAYHASTNDPGIIEMTRAASDGGVDPSFLATQVQGTQIASGPASMALQSTGKIVVLGQYFNNNPNDFVVFRYNADGSADGTWGIGGRRDVPFTALSNIYITAADVVVQSDDKVILTGTAAGAGGSAFVAVRLTANGGIDSSYGSGGQVVITRFGQVESAPPLETLRHARITSKGNLILGGLTKPVYVGAPFPQLTSASVALAKLTAAGQLDSTVGDGGVVIYAIPSTIGAADIAVTRSESVYALLVGAPGVLRFLKDGSADFSFGSFGLAGFTPIDPISLIQTITITHSLALQRDGKVVVAGEADVIGGQHEAMAARLQIDGNPDPSFGTPGCGTGVFLQSSALASPAWEEADSVTVQYGRVLLGGRVLHDATSGLNYIPIIYGLTVDRIFVDGLELLP